MNDEFDKEWIILTGLIILSIIIISFITYQKTDNKNTIIEKVDKNDTFIEKYNKREKNERFMEK